MGDSDAAVLKALCSDLEGRCEELEEQLAAANERVAQLTLAAYGDDRAGSPPAIATGVPVPVDDADADVHVASSSSAAAAQGSSSAPEGAPIAQAFEILSLLNHCVDDETAEGMAAKCALVRQLVEQHAKGGGGGKGDDASDIAVLRRLALDLEEQVEKLEEQHAALQGDHDALRLEMAGVRGVLADYLKEDIASVEEGLAKLKAKA